MAQTPVKKISIKKINIQEITDEEDVLAVEEPLEIRMIYGAASQRQLKSISVTMRTPGQDEELAAGFLFTEGILTDRSQIEEIFNNPEDCGNRQDNMINIVLADQVTIDLQKLERHFYTSSSCGVCGKASINAIHTVKQPYQSQPFYISPDLLHHLPTLLNQQQEVFRHTGGLHASAIFSLDGQMLALREDVGRHNALDKLIGHFFLQSQIPLSRHLLLLSGRASFELIQKAAMAGIQVVAAVGAPSSLAVQLAQDSDITLIGFLRNERFNIYSGAHRVIA